MYIISPGFIDKVTGAITGSGGSNGSNVTNGSNNSGYVPGLGIGADKTNDLFISALAILGLISPNSQFTDYLYDALKGDKNGFFGSSDSVGDIKDNLLEYFQGFMTNQGKENQLNRLYNTAEALANRDFQSAEAQKQRDWYEAMSNSAYTRAVADMKNAGINPILAYAQGGAASSGTGLPSSSAASYNSTGGDTVSSLLSAMADVIYAVSGASSNKVSTAFKLFRMAGG